MSSSSSAPAQGALRRLAPRLACAARRAASRSTPRVVAAAGAKKGKGKDEAASVYKETVNLPKTSFDLRANSKTKEPELQAWWDSERIYERLAAENPGPPWVLHDGPPYANGDLHIGHALNKVLKDFINRYQSLRGRRVTFVPGWDCHGLPIELKVLQSLPADARRALTPLALRAAARDYALAALDGQRASFRRYGVWGDWATPYATLQPAYEAAQLRVFAAMLAKGHIYRGLKPVNWSPSSRTALAEAELEYPEGHVSRSVYVALPIASTAAAAALPAEAADALVGAALAVWTTTPWTLPANAAVAVNTKLRYAVARCEGGAAHGRVLVVAEELVGSLSTKLGCGSVQTLALLRGAQLEGVTYRHPLAALGGELAERLGPVVDGGDYVTCDAGTGLVHTAPGHGADDYATGLRCGLPLRSPVDDAGRFTSEAGVGLEGLAVLKEGTAACIDAAAASGALLLEEKYAHKYPYDWRSKQPTIVRATEQWFASVERFRDDALAAIAAVTWIPAVGAKRIQPMVAGRSDWCISRQRAWGVPIPAFFPVDPASGEPPLMDAAVMEHVIGLVAQHGSDCWWSMSNEELLPPQHRHRAAQLVRGTDTMDVWFDSGSSWAGVLGERGLGSPADLYLEGSDQHRGWFQSSLLMSVAATGSAPFRAVLTHGFVLDEKGAKMSKSLGNVVDPRRVIDGGPDAAQEPAYGADVLRLWVASCDYSGDVLLGAGILKQTAEAARKLRGTLRYLLGNLHDFQPAAHAVSWEALAAVDRHTLRKLGALCEEVREHYDAYSFSRAFAALNAFAVTHLSNFYLDAAKDRLYIRAPDAASRRACQTTLAACLRHLGACLAPLAPHLAEEAWQAAPQLRGGSQHASVFQAGWPEVPAEWLAPPPAAESAAVWEALLSARGEVNKLCELARGAKAIGAGLEARVALRFYGEGAGAEALRAALSLYQDRPGSVDGSDELRYLFLVSSARIVDSDEDLTAFASDSGFLSPEPLQLPGGCGLLRAALARADGAKCERCWGFSPLVGRSGRHPTLCERCEHVADALQLPPAAELRVAASAAAAAAAAATV